MKKSIAIICILMAFSQMSLGQNKIVFMPQWTPQAQFAGYYVALEKGFYADAGIDVEIRHMNASTRKNSASHLRNGDIDITTMQLLQAIVNVDAGLDIVNILQTSQQNSLCIVSHEPIPDFKSLEGKKIGIWKTGFSELLRIMAEDYNLSYKSIPFLNGISLFTSKAIDATFALKFNEYQQLKYAMGVIPPENVINFADHGYNIPEDGLYTTTEFYNNNTDAIQKFVEASKLGWKYAAAHKQETLEIVKKYTQKEKITTNDIVQKAMLDEILELQVDPVTRKRSFEHISKTQFNNILDRCLKAGLISNRIDYVKFIR